MPPKASLKPFMREVVDKAIERLGKKQLWRVVRAVRGAQPADASAVRERLRDLGIYVSDAHFEAMEADYGTAPFSKDAFMKDFFAAFPPIRRHAVDLVVLKLDPEGTGRVSYRTLDREFDALRHPDVVSNTRDEDVITADFFDSIMDDMSAAEGSLTTEELMGYYVGISATTPQDEAFELRCIRSFCLDRPRLNTAEETERMQGSQRFSRQSRLLGPGRKHPLYATSNEVYGKEAVGEACRRPEYGLSQKFTKNLPKRAGTGGASTMNI
ncbi:hypothetical protein STCU_04665 [Strigomonas culicis]|uniref:EF-hand domain-containing protein n=1 Tax=Strigomonas culicis TaxID=28005 RepID=S9UKB4_9TRYP|nr:hypothetical protein STCU_04665 [Strigomonas culicis]|eukprot:EPY29219.1 hypothetical protein STCU_04665 [Strigomonas culicis]